MANTNVKTTFTVEGVEKIEASIKKAQKEIIKLTSKQKKTPKDKSQLIDEKDKLEKLKRQKKDYARQLDIQQKKDHMIQKSREQTATKSQIDSETKKQKKQEQMVVASTRERNLLKKGAIQQMQISGLTEAQSKKAYANVEQRMKKQKFKLNENGDWFNKHTGKIIGQNKAMSYASRSVLPVFQGWMLSTMFIAQGLANTFGGMIKQTLGMTGIFEAFSGILAGVLLPALMPIVTKLLDVFSWLSSSEMGKSFITFLIISLAVLGYIVSMAAQIGILFFSLGANAALFGGVLLTIVGVMILIWGIIELVQSIINGDLVRGLKAVSIILIAIAAIWAGIAIATGIALSPIILIVAAVAAIVAGIAWVIQNWEKLGNLFTGNGFKTNMEVSGVPETQLATGGVVTKPTTALIGEAGPEAVIPLNKMGDSGIGSTINYNPTINVEMSGGSSFDARSLASKINEALHDDLRSKF